MFIKIFRKILGLLKTIANDPNNIKRGINRIGIALGILVSLFLLIYTSFSLFIGLLDKGYQWGSWLVLVAPIMFALFCITPALLGLGISIVLAKAIGWIIQGFKKDKDRLAN